MDKVKKYQDILLAYLNEYASKSKLANAPEVENKVVADLKNNAFQLLRIGWRDHQFIFSVVFHFDIKNDKVWFQRNITEREVVDKLMEMGIPKEDIVIGFQPPIIREQTGFAVA